MHFEITSDPAEDLRAQQLAIKAALPRSRSTLILAIVFFLATFVTGVLSHGDDLIPPSVLAVSYFALIGGFRWDQSRRVRLARQADPNRSRSYSLDITQDEIRCVGAHMEATYRWQGFTKVVETPEFFLFVRGTSAVPFIAKRRMNSDQIETLRGYVRIWLASQKNGSGTQTAT